MELGTGGGRGTCVSCPKPMYHVRGGNFNSVCEKRFIPFSVVTFIIFYKCGIWAFLGCLACFMCFGWCVVLIMA